MPRYAEHLLKWITRIAAVPGLILILVSTTPVLRWWTDALSARWGNESGETLIVLGGDIVGPDAIGLSSYWRSYYAVREWRQQHYSRIVVTGHTVAALMRDFMVAEGVPASVLATEDAATTTHESAVFVARTINSEPGRKVLLTSDFHMGRALGTFRKAGIEASPLPIPDARKRVNDPVQCWALFCQLLQETGKTVYYKLRGWM